MNSLSVTPLDSIPGLIEKQREYFSTGRTRDLELRISCLKRFEDVMVQRKDEILTALEKDLGKPAFEAFLAEYFFILEEVRLMRRSLKRWLKPRRVRSPFYFWPCRSEVRCEPFGVSLIISPWNYPLQLSLSPLISAVAAGNTVVLKPSELAPASEQLLGEILSDVFPPEHVTVVTGGVETAEALLEESFDFLFFTGSTEVGRIVAEKAARHLTPTILELGGKCPCVVDCTADLSATARRILIGKLFNAGQTCFSPDFIAVHEEVKDDFVQALTEELENSPWEQELAHIINKRHYERLRNLIPEKCIAKGEDDPSALHLAPRILPEVTWDDPALQEEVFGPLLPVVGFSEVSEVVKRLRSLSSPLALYCFSRDKDFAEELMSHVPSGGVCLNDVSKHASNLQLPFGGIGESGHGRYRGKTGVLAFTYERAVTRRYFFRDVFEMVPPRDKQYEWMSKWMS